MKAEIVQEIFEKLQALGLDPTRGGASDITVNMKKSRSRTNLLAYFTLKVAYLLNNPY